MKHSLVFILLQLLTFYNSALYAQWVQTNGPCGGSVNCFAVSGTNIFAGTDYSVFLSTNNGANWTQVNNGLTNSTNISALTVSGNNIFAGTWGGGVFLSTNNGTNWTQVNNGLTYTNVFAFTVSGTNMFAVTDGGVFLSTNNGTNWTQVNNDLPYAISVYSFTVIGTNIFAGTNDGVYLSTNDGTSWTSVDNGLPTKTPVYALIVSGTNIFAGTKWTGVCMRPLSELVGVTKEGNDLPHEFTLSQNYPNPFNPSTTINYSLAKEGNVKLTVYNSIGSKVVNIVDQFKLAGNYSVQFNAGSLASGIYLYRLESGNDNAAKKFILMK